MTNRALTFLSVPALMTGLALLAAPAAAQTDCQPGDLFCAELRIGPGSGSIRVGPADPVPPPPPVVVEPAPQPPTVIVQPAPPPPPVVQPPTVIVQPTPPPQPVYQPPPTVYVQPMQQRVAVPPRDRYPSSSVGLNLHLDGVVGEDLGMGGGGIGMRFRPIPHLAVDLGASLIGGVDYNGLDRLEVPVTADVLFFFNPHNRLQFYAMAGIGLSIAHAEGYNVHTRNLVDRDYAHFGGSLGLGLEWRLSRFFALNLDVRGFIRQRVDGNSEPEFVELRGGSWQATDTSGGFAGRLGMTFYFAD